MADLHEQDIKIEVRRGGRWVEVTANQLQE